MLLEPIVAKNGRFTYDTDREDWRRNPKLLFDLSCDVLDHLRSFRAIEKVRLADQNHDTPARSIERIHNREVLHGDAQARIDHQQPQIASREIRQRFSGPAARQRTKSRCVDKGYAFPQPGSGQFEMNLGNMPGIVRIALLSCKFP